MGFLDKLAARFYSYEPSAPAETRPRGTWREISREEAVAQGLPLYPPYPKPLYELERWSDAKRLDHRHDSVVYVWEAPPPGPLRPGLREAVLVSRNPETTARLEELRKAREANPWRLAYCSSCFDTRVVSDFDPTTGPDDRIAGPYPEIDQKMLEQYERAERFSSGKAPWNG